MSQKAVVHVLCDVCLKKDDTETEATFSDVISIGSTKREIELCDVHRQIVNDVLSILEQYGSKTGFSQRRGPTITLPPVEPPTKRRKASVPVKCRFCGNQFRGGAGAAAHERSVHPEEYEQAKAIEEARNEPAMV